ncbi:hypothetical protein SARC_04270, partial [Sphaeroforma arctica JP610]
MRNWGNTLGREKKGAYVCELKMEKANAIKLALKTCKKSNNAVLDLSNSELTDVPPKIKECSHVEELYLYGNKLSTLPVEFKKLTCLTTLILSENNIREIPPAMSFLKLEVFDLRHNKLTEIPDVVYNCTTLKKLYLRQNRIQTIGPEIAKLK